MRGCLAETVHRRWVHRPTHSTKYLSSLLDALPPPVSVHLWAPSSSMRPVAGITRSLSARMAICGVREATRMARCALSREDSRVALKFLGFKCGHSPCKEVSNFTLIKGPILAGKKQKVIQVGAGISFSLCLTDDGKGMHSRPCINCIFNGHN
jgi:hypothetical protein